MKYKIDVVRIRENSIQLNGWVIGKTPESKAEFEVLDQNKKPLEIKCVATRRDDVSQIYYKQVYDRDYAATVLYATVRVMYQARKILTFSSHTSAAQITGWSSAATAGPPG